MSATPHLDDEQLTALQDGDGSPGERAHLHACARCRARADALGAVAALVAAPPSPPADEAREAAVATAVAAADRPVVAPRRPVPGRRRRAWLLPAAAVVALLALVAVVVPQWGDGSDSDAGSTAAGQASRAARSDDDEAAGGGGEEAAERAAAPPATDLGAVDDEADLARRVDTALAARTQADASPTTEDPCTASFGAGDSALGSVRFRASLAWRGQPAEVLSDGDRAVVVAAGGCSVLATVDLP